MKLPNSEPINDPASIGKLQSELLAMATEMLGARDQSYKICETKLSDGGQPITIPSIISCEVQVFLSCNGKSCWPTVVYEMAHETVHLLDPVKKSEINYLEEGVAVAFSIYAQERFGVKVQSPSPDKQGELQYFIALRWVNELPSGALESARRIRREVGQFSAVLPEDLLKLYPPPALDPAIANALTTSFYG